ncbi:uncharacterized protein ColSpa_07161 [Colletotrichum spaethianum]|uniref:Uncharacterized protein n=1 Tax=Colletotrichum spaethianum TaxID=700344 RepID=A0AA37LI35_9PEZI|nr:uncharacterized protein ColSpa_07161 [Colletotrichum spaethianum]GKT46980.1 hypothetical protein ColSpa_07161 [Colletotrichum spaethianum]
METPAMNLSLTMRIASHQIEFQQQNPQQMFCAPQNYQMPSMHPQSSLPAPWGTVNPLDTIKEFGSQTSETPQLFRQGHYWNGPESNYDPTLSMPLDFGGESQEIGLHAYRSNMATGNSEFENQHLGLKATPYSNSPTGGYLFYSHNPADVAFDASPHTVNPSTNTTQETLPPHGLSSRTPIFREKESGEEALDDVDFSQWIHEEEVYN